jgi:hypothetical protein
LRTAIIALLVLLLGALNGLFLFLPFEWIFLQRSGEEVFHMVTGERCCDWGPP